MTNHTVSLTVADPDDFLDFKLQGTFAVAIIDEYGQLQGPFPSDEDAGRVMMNTRLTTRHRANRRDRKPKVDISDQEDYMHLIDICLSDFCLSARSTRP